MVNTNEIKQKYTKQDSKQTILSGYSLRKYKKQVLDNKTVLYSVRVVSKEGGPRGGGLMG